MGVSPASVQPSDRRPAAALLGKRTPRQATSCCKEYDLSGLSGQLGVDKERVVACYMRHAGRPAGKPWQHGGCLTETTVPVVGVKGEQYLTSVPGKCPTCQTQSVWQGEQSAEAASRLVPSWISTGASCSDTWWFIAVRGNTRNAIHLQAQRLAHSLLRATASDFTVFDTL